MGVLVYAYIERERESERERERKREKERDRERKEREREREKREKRERKREKDMAFRYGASLTGIPPRPPRMFLGSLPAAGPMTTRPGGEMRLSAGLVTSW